MIKVNDIQIGDKLLDLNRKAATVNEFLIGDAGHDYEHIIRFKELGRFGGYISKNDVLPIPITLNMLEQQGIEIKYLNGNNHLQYQVAHDEDKYHYVIDSIADDFGDWQYITKEIEFVHQLQQLVRIFEKRELILKF